MAQIGNYSPYQFSTALDPVSGLPKSQLPPGVVAGGAYGTAPPPLPPGILAGGAYGTRPPSVGSGAAPNGADAAGSVLPPSAFPSAPTPQGPQLPSFDYQAAILSDPAYMQAQADISANGVADRSQLTAARQRAIAQFGFVPDFNGQDQQLLGPDFQSDLTPEVRGLAQQNTAAGLSTEARLNQAHTQQRQALINALAATGRLHSGEAGYQLGLDQQQFSQGQYDANQKLLDALSGYAGGYAQNQRQLEYQRQAAAEAAAQRQLQLYSLQAQAYPQPQAQPPPGAPPPPPPPAADLGVPLVPHNPSVPAGFDIAGLMRALANR